MAIPAGRWAGTRVGVHGFFLALLVAAAGLGWGAQALLVLGSLLAHELAHLLVARLLEVEVEEILLTPVGGVARMDPLLADQPHLEVAVALAGPFQSGLLAGLAYLLGGSSFWDRELVRFFFEVNASLAGFNLLPALPLDGGRALRGLLAHRYGTGPVSRWMAWSGRITGGALTAWGLVALAAGQPYPAAVLGGPYLFWLAGQEEQQVLLRATAGLLRKRREAWQRRVLQARTLVVGAEVPLREVLPHLARRSYHLILVVDRHLVPLGTLSEPRLLAALEEFGPEVPLGDLLD